MDTNKPKMINNPYYFDVLAKQTENACMIYPLYVRQPDMKKMTYTQGIYTEELTIPYRAFERAL